MTVYTLYFDGACAPNPGSGAWGAVLFPGDSTAAGASASSSPSPIRDAVWVGGGLLGTGCTNNVAEYCGLIGGLRGAAATLWGTLSGASLRIAGDSELVLGSIGGTRRTIAPRLQVLHAIATGLLTAFGAFSVGRVCREVNALADTLAVAALRSTPGEVPLLRPCLAGTARLTIGGVTTAASHDAMVVGGADGVCCLDSRYLCSLPRAAGGGLPAFGRLTPPPPHLVTVAGRGHRYAILGMLRLDVVVQLGGPPEAPCRVSSRVSFAVVDHLPVPAHIAFKDEALRGLGAGGIDMSGGGEVQEAFAPLYADEPFWDQAVHHLPASLLTMMS